MHVLADAPFLRKQDERSGAAAKIRCCQSCRAGPKEQLLTCRLLVDRRQGWGLLRRDEEVASSILLARPEWWAGKDKTLMSIDQVLRLSERRAGPLILSCLLKVTQLSNLSPIWLSVGCHAQSVQCGTVRCSARRCLTPAAASMIRGDSRY